MSWRVLVLRPEPGASATAARAAGLGLDPVVAPLFEIRPVAWQPPSRAEFDAVLITSANAARQGDAGLFATLPCYAVGEASAAAAREAGFKDVRVGRSDGAAAAAAMAADGICRALHLCGRDHIRISAEGVRFDRQIVYAAEPVDHLAETAVAALDRDAIALLHSPRAARLFSRLVTDRDRVRIATISPAVADAAGEGWAGKWAAALPRDEALLELAVQLCQTGGNATG